MHAQACWAVSAQQALKIQEQLAPRVRRRPLGSTVHAVAGADCRYDERAALCAAAVVVWDLEKEAVVDAKTALSEVRFPYLPGLFAFREAPAIIGVLELLTMKPQLLICDGHGIAHPRRFGLASHVGVLTGVPTIGCAKRRLCGSFAEPGSARGSRSALIDGSVVIGTVLRTRAGVRPVFVSVPPKRCNASSETRHMAERRCCCNSGSSASSPRPLSVEPRIYPGVS